MVIFFFPEDRAVVNIDVGLAYRDDTVSEWTEMAHSFEQRKLNCSFTTTKVLKTLTQLPNYKSELILLTWHAAKVTSCLDLPLSSVASIT